ncbi:MAG: hypothetical protein K5662_02390 [Lachnospiraceae bacterium]|nr:hypothetical protein [Lachnospiraceae bacterium]
MKEIQIIRGKERLGEILFIIGIVLELVVMMTDHCASFTLPLRGRVTQVAFALFALKILTTGYRPKQFIIMILCGVVGVVSYLTCKDEMVVRLTVMVLSSVNIDLDRCLKIILAGTLLGTVAIICMSVTGIAGDMYSIADFGRGGEEKRWMFGFNHANNLHCMYWYITSLVILIYRERIKIPVYVALLAGDMGLFFLTRSRSGLLAVTLVIVLCLVAEIFPKGEKSALPYVIGMAIVVMSFVFTVIASALGTEGRLLGLLNKVLNSRLYMCYKVAPLNEWKIFPGSRVTEYALDNGIAYIAYIYGIAVMIMFLAAIMYLCIRACRKRQMWLLALTLGYVGILFMESSFVTNVSLLCCFGAVLLLGRLSSEDEEKVEKRCF